MKFDRHRLSSLHRDISAMGSTTRSRKLFPLAIGALVVVLLIVVTVWVRSRQNTVASGAPDSTLDQGVGNSTGSRAATSTARPASRPLPLSRQDAQALVLRSVERRREARKDSAKRSEVMRTRVAAQFDAEKIDTAWAPGKQTALEKISSLPQITTSVAPPKNMSVTCRSSMCRIDSAFDSNGNAEDWTMVYMASVGSALPNAVVSRVQNADGTTSVRIYGRGR